MPAVIVLTKNKENWWAWQDLNLQPDAYEPSALTIELQARYGAMDYRAMEHGR